MQKSSLLVLTIVLTLVIGTLVTATTLGKVQAKPCNSSAGGAIDLHSCDPPTPPAEDPSIDHASPNYAPGEQLQIDGDNYPPETHLDITLDGIAIGQVFTNSNGQFSTQTHIPTPFELGVHPLRVGEIGAREFDIEIFAPPRPVIFIFSANSQTIAVPPGEARTMDATCDQGAVVGGGYFQVTPEITIIESIPLDRLNWRITAHNTHPNLTFNVTAIARCALDGIAP